MRAKRGVSKSPESIENRPDPQKYATKTRGERDLPAVRPVGEGVYEIVRHDAHTHFAYALELPKGPGEAQAAFNIKKEASYVLSIKNPQADAPLGAGLAEPQVQLPRDLQNKFRGRRFCEADPPDFLNYQGAEFVLISAAEDVSDELGIQLHPENESVLAPISLTISKWKKQFTR